MVLGMNEVSLKLNLSLNCKQNEFSLLFTIGRHQLPENFFSVCTHTKADT